MTALEAAGEAARARRRGAQCLDKEDLLTRAKRAIKLHLNTQELEISAHKVNSSGYTLLHVVVEKLRQVDQSGTNLRPAWWCGALKEFGLGNGVIELMTIDFEETAVHPKLEAAMNHCWAKNPAARKSIYLKAFLQVCKKLTRREFHYLCHKSVEQVGVLRAMSDQMLFLALKYITRFKFPHPR